jgi:hypothetical protein
MEDTRGVGILENTSRFSTVISRVSTLEEARGEEGGRRGVESTSIFGKIRLRETEMRIYRQIEYSLWY